MSDSDYLDIHDLEPDQPDITDAVHTFLLERRAANDDRPTVRALEEAYNLHTAQEVFDLGRRTYLTMIDRFALAQANGA